MTRRPRTEPGQPSPDRVTIPAPLDVHAGDFVMTATPGRARRKGWAAAFSEADLARLAMDEERNPIYPMIAILRRYLISGAAEPPQPLADAVRLSEPELLALFPLAKAVVALAADSDLSPQEKAERVAAALGFVRPGWNAFSAFEGDAVAHHAVHVAAVAQREGAGRDEALAKAVGEANKRTAERRIARGRKRGARPFATKPPP